MKPKYPIAFKLPLADGWYYEVRIFANRPKMYEHRRKMNKQGFTIMRKFDFNAMVSTDSYTKDHRRKKQFGTMIFTRHTANRVGVVTHEIYHAASFWWQASRKTNDIIGRHNEAFAKLIGELSRRYWIEWWKRFDVTPYPKNSIEVDVG